MGKYLTPDAPPPNEFICRRLRIPANADFLSLVSGAIASLLFESAWEQHGALTPAETAQYFKQMWIDKEDEQGCMIGEIKAFMRTTLPVHVLPCNGSIFQREDYPDLYALLPDSLKLSADEFMTPDLTRRGLVGVDTSLELGDIGLGDTVGAETVTLTEAELPSHTHDNLPHGHTDLGHSHIYQPPGITLLGVVPGEAPLLAPSLLPTSTLTGNALITDSSITISPTGGGGAFSIRNPDMGVKWGIVAL